MKKKLQYFDYHADGFESEQNGAEEKREIVYLPDGDAVVERQRVPEDVVEYNGESGEHDSVREGRKRCQEFQILDVINENQGYQNDRHVLLQFHVNELAESLEEAKRNTNIIHERILSSFRFSCV